MDPRLERAIQENADVTAEIKSGISNFKRRIDRLETAMQRPGFAPPESSYETPQNKRARFKYEGNSEEDKAFFGTYLRKGNQFLEPSERKTLILASDSSAGYLAPVGYTSEIIKGIEEFSPIRENATVREIADRGMEFPKRSALPDAHWVGEIEDRIADESLAYAMETLTPHEMACLKKLSLQQLEDSRFSLETELGEAFAESFGILEGTAFVVGTGVKQPEGILTNPDVGDSETAAAGVIGPLDLVGITHEILRGYRRNAKWYMNDTTIGAIRSLRDLNERFLFIDPVAGEPAKLLGYEVVSCPDFPDVAEGAFPLVFGDMRRAYLIVDRIQMSIQRISELYAEKGIVGFLGRRRVDGQVVLPGAIVKMKIKVSE